MKAVPNNTQRAISGWGDPLPEFIRLLANYADRCGQRGAGAKIGRSSATVSKILRNIYPASVEETKILVMAGFSAGTADCPIFGEIPLASCVRNRRRKGPPINTLQRHFAAACPNCPQNPDLNQENKDVA